jgi:hypothetical protein
MKAEIQLMEAVMTRHDFTIQKTMTENNIGRISEGTLTETNEEIILITHFKNTTVSLATRHAMRDHLHHIINQFQENDQHYFVIKKHNGIPLKQYLLRPHFDLDSRIYICYELLKVIRKYEVFPDTIKYQLIQLSQWEIVEDVLMLKEAILFDEQTTFFFKDVLKQIAYLMELIIQPTLEPQIQFIENLVIGNHHYTELDSLISDFKAIFIYEKSEVIAAIPREFNLVFSEHASTDETFSHEPQPIQDTQPLNEALSFLEPDSDSSEKKPLHVSRTRDLSDDLFLEENEMFLSELFGPVDDLPTHHEKNEPVIDTETPVQLSLHENIKTLESNLSKLVADNIVSTSPSVPFVAEELPPFCDLSSAEDPFSPDFTGQPALVNKAVSDERDPFTDIQSSTTKEIDVNETDAEDATSSGITRTLDRNIKYYIFPILATLVLLALIALGSKLFFFKPDTLEASYQIESLADNRVAFINTSTASSRIDMSEWRIYYDDRLIQQFVTDNLYPIFDTEGNYTIELRIKDSDGRWSGVYREVFPYFEDSSNEGASLENANEESTTH